jgi:hypothetical protein
MLLSFWCAFLLSVFSFGDAARGQTIDGSSIPAFRESVEAVMPTLSDDDKLAFQAGLFGIAFDHHGLTDVPDKLKHLVMGLVTDDMPVLFDGLKVSEIIAVGQNADSLPSFAPPPGLFRHEEMLGELEAYDPALAVKVLKRGLTHMVREECDDTFLERALVFPLPEGIGNVPGKIGEAIYSQRLSLYGQSLPVTFQGLPTQNATLVGPLMRFERRVNDYNQPVFNPELSAKVMFGKDYFRWAASQLVQRNLPANSCELRFHDHHDYNQTVSGPNLTIGNTITSEHWKCGRIKFGIGSKGYKTRLFKTTSSQDFRIMTEFLPQENALKVNFSATDEKRGPLLSDAKVFRFGESDFELGDIAGIDGLDWNDIAVSTEFEDATPENGDRLMLRMRGTHIEPMNTYEACTALEKIVADQPVAFEAYMTRDAIMRFGTQPRREFFE